MRNKLIAVFLLSCIAAQGQGRNLNIEDIYRLQSLSETQVSPDGRWVAYVSTQSDREADETRSAVWMVSWDGKEQVRMTVPASGIEQPRFSPDGHYLSYLVTTADGARTQLMLLDRRGGDGQPLLTSTGSIKHYDWAPDGAHVALILQEDEQTGSHPKPLVIETLHFKDDHIGYVSSAVHQHLYLLEVSSGKLEALTTDDRYHEADATFAPDGRQIAFTRTQEIGADSDGRADLAVIAAKPGAAAHVLARPFVPNSQHLAFSPDGKWITYLEGAQPKINAYMQDRLIALPSAGGAPKALSASLDRAIASYAFENSSDIVVAIEDDRSVYPARIDVNSGRITRAATRPHYSISDVVSGGGHTAVLKTDDATFPEVHALEGSDLRKLSTLNDAWTAEVQWGAVEELAFESRDGSDIHGLMVKPVSFVTGHRYPLLLWIHGGPSGQDQHSLALNGYEFEPQIFAAKGYLVLCVNYRGGSGRGLKFATDIMADWGHKEVMDLLAGVDNVVSSGIADPDRLIVGGWSYGGILTDYIIASDSRFKAAIAGAGSGNQLSTYGADQYVLQYNHELQPPWVGTQTWLKVSYPFFHADRIHTPTLFLGGDKDFNVPIAGGEQMYQALKTLNVPAQLIIYPGEHHVFDRPSFVVDLERRMTAWIAKFAP